MNKTIPYIYFAVAAIWIIQGVRDLSRNQDSYYLFFGYETSSIIEYVGFKVVIVALFVYGGIRRLKMGGK